MHLLNVHWVIIIFYVFCPIWIKTVPESSPLEYIYRLMNLLYMIYTTYGLSSINAWHLLEK